MTSIAPNLEVIVFVQNIDISNGIFLYLENDDSLVSFEESILSFSKPLRIFINTSGFLHSNIIKPEKRLTLVKRSN